MNEVLGKRPRVMVLAPTPLLTVTIEAGAEGDEIHFHPGGQGVWVGHLVASLGVDVVLCASFGGETGTVIRALLEQWGIDVRAVDAAGWNGSYLHDRRSGERQSLAEMNAPGRSRHEVDELYGAAIVAGLESDVVVLGGPENAGMARADVPDLLPLEIYTRLARDLRRNGTRVIADLCGPVLAAALDGGARRAQDQRRRARDHRRGGGHRQALAVRGRRPAGRTRSRRRCGDTCRATDVGAAGRRAVRDPRPAS